MKRTCSKCKQDLDISEFNQKGTNKQGDIRYQTFCKTCNAEYSSNWYKNNSQRIIDKNREYKQRMRVWYIELKESMICSICGEDHVACLDFHHNDPAEKDGIISESPRRWGKKKILAEIAKCTVLCSNCHRKLHWDEKYGPEAY